MSGYRQWFNPNLPIVNTQGLRDVLVLQPQATATFVDLRSVFGGLDTGGGKLIVRADGAGVPTGAGLYKSYFAMSTAPNAIDETKLGTNSGACWPLQDGESFYGRILGGREVATGYATGVAPYILNYKSPAGGGVSGYLRVMRAPDDNVDASAFRIPIPSGYGTSGSGTQIPSGAWWQS